MAQGFLLSVEDQRILQELINREKRRNRNTTNRPAVLPTTPPAPETYIAFTPGGGIPALDYNLLLQTGTPFGPAVEDDVPGAAFCDIYRIVLESGVNPRFHPTGISRKVHNLSTTAIPQYTWIPIFRDKFGHWITSFLQAGTGTADDMFALTVQDEGDTLPQQQTINLVGGTVTASDDPGNNRTNITHPDYGILADIEPVGLANSPGINSRLARSDHIHRFSIPTVGPSGRGTGTDVFPPDTPADPSEPILIFDYTTHNLYLWNPILFYWEPINCCVAHNTGTGTAIPGGGVPPDPMGIETLCCPTNPLPETLTGTFTDKTGDCSALPDTIEFNWSPGDASWFANTSVGGFDMIAEFVCDEGVWNLSFPVDSDCRPAIFSVDFVVCDPFVATCSLEGFINCCTGNATLTITE